MKGKGVALLLILLLTITLATATDISLLPTPTIEAGTASNAEYTANYAETPTSGETVSFTRGGITIGLQPHSLNYNNALSQLQQISMPQNVQRNKNGESYEYANAYGENITLRYENHWWGVKEEIIIQNKEALTTPEQYVTDGGGVTIEANFLLTTNAQHINVNGAEWDKSSETTTEQDINIYDDNNVLLYHLPRPIAIDANNNEANGSYTLKKSANKLYVSINIPYDFIETATYPVTIDPSFYVDYSPTPATYYSNDNQLSTDYSSFSSSSDATIALSDGNTNTYVTVSNTPTTSQDDVVRARFAHSYQIGYTYFLRIYKNNAGATNMTVYASQNDTHINLSRTATMAVDGIGYYSLEVTDLMQYMSNQSLNYSDFRITSTSTANNILLSEVVLRQEENDTIPPQISTCYADNLNATCDENITFSCVVTDNIEVERVLFSGYLNGVGELTYQAIKNNNIYYYTFTHSGYGEEHYNWTNVTAIDVFANEAYQEQDVIATYTCIDNCTPNWVAQYDTISPCRTNNTLLQIKTYVDTNTCDEITGLPSDNGTIIESYCNYCDPEWTNLAECLENNTILNDYYDSNFCYAQTNLTEDSPPINDGEWTACDYYDNDFTCLISEEPYITNQKIEYTCFMPNNNDYECINILSHEQDEALQVNPQKKEKSSGLITLNTNIETRESFTTTNGILNAYYTDKNLLPNEQFVVTTICNDGNNSYQSQTSITPIIKDLDGTNQAIIWAKNNAGYIFILFLLLILLAFLIGSVWKQLRGGN